MLDLKELTKTRNNVDQLAGKRHQAAESACDQGIQYLGLAFEQGFEDKKVLKEAHRSFLQAIGLNRLNPTPYLGVTYLLLILGDPQGAQPYLHEALQLNGESEEAQVLLKYISQLRQGKLPKSDAAPQATPAPNALNKEDDVDYDELYDRLEGFLMQQLYKLRHNPVPVEPTLDPGLFRQLEQGHRSLQQTHDQIHSRLEQLEAEIDTSELQNKLKPMLSALNRWASALSQSRLWQDLLGQISSHKAETEHVTQEARTAQNPEDLKTLEENLEVILDRCDQFADQLDTLEQQGQNISPLVSAYEQLLQVVEHFREGVDEAYARLHR